MAEAAPPLIFQPVHHSETSKIVSPNTTQLLESPLVQNVLATERQHVEARLKKDAENLSLQAQLASLNRLIVPDNATTLENIVDNRDDPTTSDFALAALLLKKRAQEEAKISTSIHKDSNKKAASTMRRKRMLEIVEFFKTETCPPKLTHFRPSNTGELKRLKIQAKKEAHEGKEQGHRTDNIRYLSGNISSDAIQQGEVPKERTTEPLPRHIDDYRHQRNRITGAQPVTQGGVGATEEPAQQINMQKDDRYAEVVEPQLVSAWHAENNRRIAQGQARLTYEQFRPIGTAQIAAFHESNEVREQIEVGAYPNLQEFLAERAAQEQASIDSVERRRNEEESYGQASSTQPATHLQTEAPTAVQMPGEQRETIPVIPRVENAAHLAQPMQTEGPRAAQRQGEHIETAAEITMRKNAEHRADPLEMNKRAIATWTENIRLAREAIEEDLMNPSLRVTLMYATLRLANLESERFTLEEANLENRQIHNKVSKWFRQQANTIYVQGLRKRVVRYASSALRQTDPSDVDYSNIYVCRGDAEYGLGNYEKAIDSFNQAAGLQPYNFAPSAKIGEAYAELGQRENALAAYNSAIFLCRNEPTLYEDKLMLLEQLGRGQTPEAEEVHEILYVLRNNGEITYNLANGRHYLHLGNYTKPLMTMDESFGKQDTEGFAAIKISRPGEKALQKDQFSVLNILKRTHELINAQQQERGGPIRAEDAILIAARMTDTSSQLEHASVVEKEKMLKMIIEQLHLPEVRHVQFVSGMFLKPSRDKQWKERPNIEIDNKNQFFRRYTEIATSGLEPVPYSFLRITFEHERLRYYDDYTLKNFDPRSENGFQPPENVSKWMVAKNRIKDFAEATKSLFKRETYFPKEVIQYLETSMQPVLVASEPPLENETQLSVEDLNTVELRELRSRVVKNPYQITYHYDYLQKLDKAGRSGTPEFVTACQRVVELDTYAGEYEMSRRVINQLAEAGIPEEALPAYQQLIKRVDTDSHMSDDAKNAMRYTILTEMGLLYRVDDNDKKAIEVYEQALGIYQNEILQEEVAEMKEHIRLPESPNSKITRKLEVEGSDVVENHQNTSETQFNLFSGRGNKFFDEGKYMEAMEAYNEALRLQPKDILLHMKIADVFKASRQLQSEQYMREEARKLREEKNEAEAKIRYEKGLKPEEIQRMAELQEMNERNTKQIYKTNEEVLSTLNLDKKIFSRALAHYRVGEVVAMGKDGYVIPELIIEYAYSEGHTAEALEAQQRLLDLIDADDFLTSHQAVKEALLRADILPARADMFYRTNQYAAAAGVYEQVAKLSPKNAFLLRRLAYSLFQSGRENEAVEVYKNLMSLEVVDRNPRVIFDSKEEDSIGNAVLKSNSEYQFLLQTLAEYSPEEYSTISRYAQSNSEIQAQIVQELDEKVQELDEKKSQKITSEKITYAADLYRKVRKMYIDSMFPHDEVGKELKLLTTTQTVPTITRITEQLVNVDLPTGEIAPVT